MPLRIGLIGYPVEHSLSPAFQQPALDALGIDARYELWPTPPDDVPSRVASLRAADVLGANVTVPHKERVAALVDEQSQTASRVGAVNTIVKRDGRLIGDNTDVHGLTRSLQESFRDDLDVASRRAVLLGAGGAARAAVLALEQLGVGAITIANRRVERAAALQDAFPELNVSISSLEPAELVRRFTDAALVINATSLGWRDGEVPFDPVLLDQLPDDAIVLDLTYRETALLAAARARGLQAVDGLAMLVYQGARAFALWTGRDAPESVMMEHAAAARTHRP